MDCTQLFRFLRTSSLFFVFVSGLSVSDLTAQACETPTCEKLRGAGISNAFLQTVVTDLQDAQTKKIVELNVLGFLGKANYDAHYSAKALKSTRAFIRKYRTVFVRAERLYGVPKEVIASLIWVESKHGRDVGKLSVGETYFRIAHADLPAFIESTYQAGVAKSPEYEGLRAKVEGRSAKKAGWAVEQLLALQEMMNRGINTSKLTGSYAGAFGLPQFLPASYLSWAKPWLAPTGRASLYLPQDAIVSVGNYLKSNGWRKSRVDSHRAALYHYNNAEGYVNVILKIAAEVGTQRPTSAAKPVIGRR